MRTIVRILVLTASSFIAKGVTGNQPVAVSQQSLWHSLDGIPFLFSRRSTRKLSTKYVINDAIPSDSFVPNNTQQMHRSLAFGDYTDPTFDCPATTTCPVVCVNAIDDCPADATCAQANPDAADHEFELCNDGTCADVTLGEACDAELESPCTCGGLEVTCPKQIDLYDQCFERFQTYYDENTECVENEQENLPQVDFRVAIIAFFGTLISVTGAMFLWCAYNQRIAPVQGSTSRLQCVSKESEGQTWTQTGYQHTVVGSILHGLVILVHLGIQGLLLFLTIEYCKYQCFVVVWHYDQCLIFH